MLKTILQIKHTIRRLSWFCPTVRERTERFIFADSLSKPLFLSLFITVAAKIKLTLINFIFHRKAGHSLERYPSWSAFFSISGVTRFKNLRKNWNKVWVNWLQINPIYEHVCMRRKSVFQSYFINSSFLL